MALMAIAPRDPTMGNDPTAPDPERSQARADAAIVLPRSLPVRWTLTLTSIKLAPHRIAVAPGAAVRVGAVRVVVVRHAAARVRHVEALRAAVPHAAARRVAVVPHAVVNAESARPPISGRSPCHRWPGDA